MKLIFLIFPILLYSQNIVVKDSLTYSNIGHVLFKNLCNESLTYSDEKGNFDPIHKCNKYKLYHPEFNEKEIVINSDTIIYLSPKPIQLENIHVFSENKKSHSFEPKIDKQCKISLIQQNQILLSEFQNESSNVIIIKSLGFQYKNIHADFTLRYLVYNEKEGVPRDVIFSQTVNFSKEPLNQLKQLSIKGNEIRLEPNEKIFVGYEIIKDVEIKTNKSQIFNYYNCINTLKKSWLLNYEKGNEFEVSRFPQFYYKLEYVNIEY